MSDSQFDKSGNYYGITRTEITHLVPKGSGRILEVGCGSGNTLLHLKEQGCGDWIGGVEINPDAARDAEKYLDQIWKGSAEQALESKEGLTSTEPFEVILCLDVLEHLLDPWAVTRQLVSRLSPGGLLITSIPNVRFYKVSLALLLKGQWTYQESGVLDSTHIRFFTRETALKMLTDAGLEIETVEPTANLKPWKNKWIFNKLSGGRLEDIYAYNFLISARNKG